MKSWSLRVALLLFAACVPNAFAQDKPKSEEQKTEEYRFTLASLKVQVIFTEYEGDKKLKSLPYTFLVTTHTRDGRPESKIRIGNRVPVYTGPGQNSWQYLDVGTNIDSWAEGVAPGQYRVYLYLERSWVEGDKFLPVDKTAASSSENSDVARFAQPIIRQYKAELTPILKDGQSLETQLATDPLSGRVVKLEVSISVLK
jgi:hypothetical protein